MRNLTHEFFDFSQVIVDDVENILKSETYVYFTKMYQLKVESVRDVGKGGNKRVVLSSSVGTIERNLCTFTLTKRQWWLKSGQPTGYLFCLWYGWFTHFSIHV